MSDSDEQDEEQTMQVFDVEHNAFEDKPAVPNLQPAYLMAVVNLTEPARNRLMTGQKLLPNMVTDAFAEAVAQVGPEGASALQRFEWLRAWAVKEHGAQPRQVEEPVQPLTLEGLAVRWEESKAELSEMKGELSEMKGELSEMKGELSELKDTIRELTGALRELSDRVDRSSASSSTARIVNVENVAYTMLMVKPLTTFKPREDVIDAVWEHLRRFLPALGCVSDKERAIIALVSAIKPAFEAMVNEIIFRAKAAIVKAEGFDLYATTRDEVLYLAAEKVMEAWLRACAQDRHGVGIGANDVVAKVITNAATKFVERTKIAKQAQKVKSVGYSGQKKGANKRNSQQGEGKEQGN